MNRVLLAAALSAVSLVENVCDAVAQSIEPLRLALQREERSAAGKERLKASVARDIERL